MMMAIGLSQHNVALFHVINHSFFKALLFLAAGAVIHSFSDEQDIRKMGGLIKFLPFTYTILLIGLAYGHYTFSGIYAYILGSLTAFVTSFYSFRLISLVFLGSANGYKKS